MNDINWTGLTETVNVAGFVLFVALLGAAGARMAWRLWQYWRVRRTPSIVLRRDIGLLTALFLVFGSAAMIRAFGWGDYISEQGVWRFLYILGADIIANVALGYWVWAEYFVIGHPGKEND